MAEPVATSAVPVAPPANKAPTAEVESADVPRPAEKPCAFEAASLQTEFWMRRSDQIALAALCGLLVLLSAWHWARLSGWGMREVEIERHRSREYEYRIDVNTATWVEWIQLPGIGEMLARRIIEDREQNGPFRSLKDLGRVKGIGPKTIENLRPYLRVKAAGEDESAE